MDIFQKMWNTFRGSPLFSFLLERPKNQVIVIPVLLDEIRGCIGGEYNGTVLST